MQVKLTLEQEARLSQLASHSGTDAEHLVRQAALRLLDEEADFHQGVSRGLAAAERGEWIDHAEVWPRIEAILRS